jgi:two-component system sensor histidine kinase/response regulator
MSGIPTFLSLPASFWFPRLVLIIALAGLAVMAVFLIRQRIALRKSPEKTHDQNLQKIDLLYALIDSMPDWIYIKDRESRFILSNKHMASYHGIKDPEEMTGRTDFDYYPEEMARIFHDDEQRIMKSGEAIVNKEEKIRDHNGIEKILSTTKIPVRDHRGMVMGIVGIGRDITRQKLDQLRLSQLSMVASGTENVVVIMDRDGNFEWVNKGFELRYGCTLDDYILKNGRNLRETSSNEQINEILEEVKRTGRPRTYTSRTQDAHSKDAWYQTNITPILNNEGEITSMFLIDSDITAIKKADLQIKQQKYELESQRDQLRKLNARKDRLFSIIAHDLKNPFQSIMGFSEILKDDFNSLTKQQIEEYLECIHQSSSAAYDLLFNLLEWARAQTNTIKFNPVQLGIRNLVEENMDLVCVHARNKNIQLLNHVEPELQAMADPNMLQTVLRNLVANAVKYTSEGGTISVSGSQGEDHVEISVEDTGVGIPEEKIKTLFSVEKGRSTPGTAGETGTGLGLLVCHEFLELNKGSIRVKSKPGKGSVFTVSLPGHP